MAITLASDLKIYEAQFQTGMTETLQQNVDAFNSASNGGIILRSSAHKGNYEYNAFFKKISSLITRQDITSDAALTPTKVQQEENIAVKLHRKMASDLTYKSAKLAGIEFDSMVFAHGEQFAKEMMAEMLNTSLLCARVALANQSDVTKDITGETNKAVSHKSLLQTLAKFGDANDRVACWVMHSQQFFDLAVASIGDDVVNIADGIIRRVDVPGLGRPVLITDSDALIATADTPDSYFVLGLAQGGIDVNESEGINRIIDQITGLEQLAVRVQAEYAYTLGLKGFKYDVGNGGANPDATTVGTATNWDKVATDKKDLAGVVLKCQAAA
jgi:hypothetical protein